MRNRTLRLATFAVLLSFSACQPQSSPSPEQDQESAPARSPAQATPFTLKIVFRGLIGFSQDSGKIRAFLVDAQYDPATVGPDDLPPGVYHELGGDMNPRPVDFLEKLRKRFPPHSASIHFFNAKISDCPSCGSSHDQGRSIFGADLTLKADSTGTGKFDLNRLTNACSIINARKELGLKRADLAKLEQLDTKLATSPSIDRRLAARVEIEVGKDDNVTANFVPDDAEKVARYSFLRPSEAADPEKGCPGGDINGQQLAEEVVVTQKRVTGSVTLILGPNDKITLKPDNPAKDVEIHILNRSHGHGSHPHAHRWFYRLLDSEGQKHLDDHFFPCRRGNFGPPDCPQNYFFIAKTANEECKP